jgi:hypothetical protein
LIVDVLRHGNIHDTINLIAVCALFYWATAILLHPIEDCEMTEYAWVIGELMQVTGEIVGATAEI